MELQLTKQIEQLMNLFRGNENAHGIYILAKSADPLKPKIKGKASTVPQCPTLKKWMDHVTGNVGIGIVPINSEDKCYFGALDIDADFDSSNKPKNKWDCLNEDGTINHIKLQTDIQKLSLPLVCCYSKSKSAHCFLFVENPISAKAMRSLLEEMSSKLGVGGCEIFPKQDKLDKERGDLGNWINMPYFGNTRKGVLLKDDILTEQSLEEFISYAISKRLTDEQVESLSGKLVTDINSLETILEGAPPCLQHILAQGIPVGNRNKVLFNIAVYCHKKYGDNFREEFSKIHDKYVDDPLSFSELETICKSAEGKEYQYQCKEPLLKKYCNANLCIDRECGIDFSSEIKTLKSATRILTDPVIYAVELELDAGLPNTVYVETDQLFSQDLFRKECSYQLKKTFTPINAKAWNEIYVRLINTATDQEPPYEMTESGQFYKQLQTYLINRIRYEKSALAEEEGVYHDQDKHVVLFRLDGFKTFLIRKGIIVQNFSQWKLSQKLNNLKIPTDTLNKETGLTIKKNLQVGDTRIKLGKRYISVREIPDEDLKLEEVQNVISDEDVV